MSLEDSGDTTAKPKPLPVTNGEANEDRQAGKREKRTAATARKERMATEYLNPGTHVSIELLTQANGSALAEVLYQGDMAACGSCVGINQIASVRSHGETVIDRGNVSDCVETAGSICREIVEIE